MSLRAVTKWLLLAPVLLLLALLLFVGFVAGTATGSGWLVASAEKQLAYRIPGASMQQGTPRALRKGLNIQSLHIPGEADGTPLIDMQNLDLHIAFRCRPRIWLCIDSLSIDQLQLSLPKAESNADTDDSVTTLSLPELEAPFGILLSSFRLGALTVNGTPATPYLENIAIKGEDLSWRGKTLSIGALGVLQQLWRYQVAGHIETTGQYVLTLNNDLKIETAAHEALHSPIAINIKLENTLEALHFRGNLAAQSATNPARIEFDGNARPLSSNLPLTINLQTKKFDASEWLEITDIASLHNLSAVAQGDLNDLRITVQGNVAPRAIAGAKQTAVMPNEVPKAALKTVPNVVPISAVALLQKRSKIVLEKFNLGTRGNQLNAQGKIEVFEGLHAKLQLKFDNFQPASLLPNPIDTVQGKIALDLAYPNDGSPLKIEAWLDTVAFNIADARYTASGNLKNDAQQNINVNKISIHAGQNHVALDGLLAPIKPTSFSTREEIVAWLGGASLDASLTLPDLKSLPIEASGALNANIILRPGQAAKIVATVAGFSSSVMTLNKMQLNATLYADLLSSGNSDSQAQLQAYGLQGNGISLDEIFLEARGNASKHDLLLNGHGADQRLGLQLNGRYLHDQSAWQGAVLPSLSWSAPAQHSPNQPGLDQPDPNQSGPNQPGPNQPGIDQRGVTQKKRHSLHVNSEQAIQLTIPSKRSQLSIGAFCLSINDARLCSDGSGTNSKGDPELAFSLAALDLEAFSTLMPAGLQWQGMLEGRATVAFPAQQAPTLQLNLVGGPGTLKSAQKRTPIEFDYDSLSLAFNANRQDLRATLLVQHRQQPLMHSTLRLSGEKFQALSGQVLVSALPLGLFAPFAPALETLQGQINAQLNIDGTTLAPKLDGTLDLLDGQIKVSNNALALDQIALHGKFSGASLALDGSFRADKGIGKIKGNIDFSNPVAGVISLSGKQLGIRAEPELDLLADLNLEAKLQGQRLNISGNVAVPEGKIELVTLPANAYKLSRDVSFVDPSNDKKTPEGPALSIEAKVAVKLGPKLLLNGFDASATLDGQLVLEQTAGKAPTGSGEIKILEGKYRGFGQRLEVRKGSLLFNGALEEPNIYLEAIRNAEDAVAGIRVTGPAANPRVEPFSEPSMPDDQIIYRIITGRAPGGTTGASQNAIIAQALISQGIKLGGSSIGSTAEKLGIENFNIGTGDGSDFQVSGYLDPTLYLEYGVNALGDGSTFKLRWDFARRLSLEFIGGLASSLDLFILGNFNRLCSWHITLARLKTPLGKAIASPYALPNQTTL